MLNLLLAYFVLVGLYHLARQVLPKLHLLIRRLSRMSKNQPLIFMALALSAVILMHPEQAKLIQVVMDLGRGQSPLETIPVEFISAQDTSAMMNIFSKMLRVMVGMHLSLP
jgi:hypothetical protein